MLAGGTRMSLRSSGLRLLMRHRSDPATLANRSHLTLRFTADVFPRFSSISYSICCPSLSVLSPARSTAEELVKNAAAIGPQHQHHTHQRASGHHTRRYRQGELLGELWFASLEQERNEGAQEEQKPIVPGKHPGETER